MTWSDPPTPTSGHTRLGFARFTGSVDTAGHTGVAGAKHPIINSNVLDQGEPNSRGCGGRLVAPRRRGLSLGTEI
jgi:hypothetical protein